MNVFKSFLVLSSLKFISIFLPLIFTLYNQKKIKDITIKKCDEEHFWAVYKQTTYREKFEIKSIQRVFKRDYIPEVRRRLQRKIFPFSMITTTVAISFMLVVGSVIAIIFNLISIYMINQSIDIYFLILGATLLT